VKLVVVLAVAAAAAAGLLARRRSGARDPYGREAVEEYPTPALVEHPRPGDSPV